MLELIRETFVPQCIKKVVEKVVFKGSHNIRQSGQLQKYSSFSVLVPPCKSRNLVLELCQVRDLRGRTIGENLSLSL